MVTRGKRKPFSVDPLPDQPKPQPADPIDWREIAGHAKGDVAKLKEVYAAAEYNGASAEDLEYIRAQANA
jgi:hypothetical protein